jgi:hypothetical protein
MRDEPTQALEKVQGNNLERLSVQDLLRQVEAIQEVQKLAMIDGEHYGIIPGTKKPTLLKGGAEKLCLLFRMDPEYEVETQIQEELFISYKIRCTLHHITTGNRLASGLGSCNSRENKYRWRQPRIKCPNCEKEQIIKGKEEYGGGWLCWKKKGGCGSKFKDGDQAIEGQSTERVENDNPWELDNTLLKMACKRALVAATLNATAASDLFTQDLEDIRGHIVRPVEIVTEPKIVDIPPEVAERQVETHQEVESEPVITESHRKHLFEIALDRGGLTKDEFRDVVEGIGYTSTAQIPVKEFDDVLTVLDDAIKAKAKQGPIPVLE